MSNLIKVVAGATNPQLKNNQIGKVAKILSWKVAVAKKPNIGKDLALLVLAKPFTFTCGLSKISIHDDPLYKPSSNIKHSFLQ